MSTRPRALIADDEPSLRSLFAAFLNEYDVIAVADGAAARHALLSEPSLAVAVIDCDMPQMTGPEVLASVRGAGCQVPVVLVSGTIPQPDTVEGDPLSVFLPKPFGRDQLIRAVASLCGPSKELPA